MRKVGVDELILGTRPRGAGEPLGSDWVDVLREIPLFASLSRRHVKRIDNLARPRRFANASMAVELRIAREQRDLHEGLVTRVGRFAIAATSRPSKR